MLWPAWQPLATIDKMSLPALQLLEKKFEKQKRIFELKKDALERKIELHFEAQRKKIEQKRETRKQRAKSPARRFEHGKGIGLDDEVRFIRTWLENPLTTGAVTPSSRA